MDFIFIFANFPRRKIGVQKNFKRISLNENPHQKMWDRFSFSAKQNSIFDQIIKSNIEFIDSGFCAKTKAPALKYGETAPNKKLRIFYNPINWQCKCFV